MVEVVVIIGRLTDRFALLFPLRWCHGVERSTWCAGPAVWSLASCCAGTIWVSALQGRDELAAVVFAVVVDAWWKGEGEG